MGPQIERLRQQYGAVEGPNKSLVLMKDGVVTDMVAYWDAHAGYHRVSDAGYGVLSGPVWNDPPAKPVEVAKEPVAEPAPRGKLSMSGKRQ